MMSRASKLFHRFVTLLLALSMVLSMPMGAMAAETVEKDAGTSMVQDTDGDGVIKYVSLGDSATNGYGMMEYTYEDGTTVRGFRNAPKDSYPYLVAQAIEEMTDMDVELDQLAFSAFRMEDLYFMLDNDVKLDNFQKRYFDHGDGEGYFKEAVEGWLARDPEGAKKYKDTELTYDQILRQEYQEAVATADVISINIGNNNFGNFLFNQLFVGLDASEHGYETDLTKFMDEDSAESIENVLWDIAAELAGDNARAEKVIWTVLQSEVYNYISFVYHFDAVMEKIYAANPDVQVVVMDMVNMMDGVTLTGELFGDFGSMNELCGIFVDMANQYTKELSPYASRLTHADLYEEEDEYLHLFFDYYKDYPDEDYANGLQDDAFQLMNDVFQELAGMTTEEMAQILQLLTAVDDMVNNIQVVVEQQIIEGAVIPGIVEGVQEAVSGVDAAVNGLKQAKEAVQAAAYAISMIPTALDGVAQAEELVDMLVEMVLGNDLVQSLFTGSQTSSMIKDVMISTIEDEIADIDIGSFGIENTPENRTMLANEIYNVACIYYDEINYNGGNEASAKRLCVIEIIRFQQIHVAGATEEEALANGTMAYDMAYAYNTEMAASGDEKKATIAALASQLDGDLEQGALAYELNEIYQAEGEEAAVHYALVSTVGEEQTALVYQINELVETEGRDAANLAALMTALPDEEIAKAFYAVYCHKTDGRTLSKQNKELAIKVGLTSQMSEAEADSVYACYLGGKDGMYYDPDVQTTVQVMLYLGGVFETTEEAAEGYGLYLMWKLLPTSFHKVSLLDTINVDILVNQKEIDFAGPLTNFIMGTAQLEKPVKQTGESDADFAARMEAFEVESSTLLMYIRFITINGALAHPSDLGHAYMAEKLVAGLERIKTPGTDVIPVATSGLSLLSMGDSLASSAGLAEGEKNYGELVAQSLGMEYSELAVAGMRVEDIRYILDNKFQGDDYAEDLFGDDSDDLAKTFQTAIAGQDVILLNVGAMNLGYALNQMVAYQDDSAYAMEFENVGIMEEMNLGARFDDYTALLKNILGVKEADALSTLLMGLKSMSYGTANFADSLEKAIDLIREENPDALIVLVGQYDMLGESYYSDTKAGLDVDLGGLAWGLSQRMNGYLATFAEMNRNVIYVDVTGAENGKSDRGLNLADADNCLEALENAHATAGGHDFMAGQITLAFTEHVFPGQLTWVWAEDGSEVSAYYHCDDCDQDIPVETTLVKTPTEGDCVTGGKLTCTATATVNGETFTDVHVITMEPTGHAFTVVEWSWAEDYTTATLTLKCGVCGEAKEPVKASVSTKTTDATCTADGETVYTATAAVDGKNYTDSKTVVLKATGHKFGEWVVTKEPTTTAKGERVRTCEHCSKTETETLPRLNNPFLDVKSTDYFFRPVLWAVEKNITAGVSENNFGPNNPCTRGQVVTFLWRAAGSPEPESSVNPFTDVKKTDYFYNAVLWAVEENITAGVSEGKFGPSVVCTRAQVVTFLWRAAGSPEAEQDKHTFTDVKETDYFHKAVLWAVENEITAGMSETKFGSTNQCTRGQIVTFLYKAYAEAE